MNDVNPYLTLARQLERELAAVTAERDAWREVAGRLAKALRSVGRRRSACADSLPRLVSAMASMLGRCGELTSSTSAP